MTKNFSLVYLPKIIFLCALLSSTYNLKSIYDGRTTPIYLDTVVSLTNGEWARGNVYFRKGFDLPPGGTVYIGIDGGFVNGPITLNGGTLILETPLILKNQSAIQSGGFIKAKSGRGIITYECVGLFTDTQTIKIQSSFIFQAAAKSAFIFQRGNIDLREVNESIFFDGGRVTYSRFLTNESSPDAIFFRDCDVITTNGMRNIYSPQVIFTGICSLTTLDKVKIKDLTLAGFTKMIMYPNSALELESITMPFNGTRLQLRNVSLDFVSTSTAPIRIITPFAHNKQGEISIEGKCDFSSSTNNTLIFDKYATLEILNGSRLSLPNGTHLIIE